MFRLNESWYYRVIRPHPRYHWCARHAHRLVNVARSAYPCCPDKPVPLHPIIHQNNYMLGYVVNILHLINFPLGLVNSVEKIICKSYELHRRYHIMWRPSSWKCSKMNKQKTNKKMHNLQDKTFSVEAKNSFSLFFAQNCLMTRNNFNSQRMNERKKK